MLLNQTLQAPIVVGHARFTVLTPLCIRMEYSPEDRFVDEKSIFAATRPTGFKGYRVRKQGSATIIDTGVIRLTYTPDGQPFEAHNLRAEIRNGKIKARWVPGAKSDANLGGTIRTLDGADGPEDLGQGLLSRDGWFLLDDSRRPLLTHDWVKARPSDAGLDWYLFGYGHDYKAALKTLADVSGPVPLPRKYAFGAWYSRYWPYSSADYRQIVAEYQEHEFPLDNIVLDMDWHKDGWTGWSWNRKLLPDAEQLLPWFHSQGLHDTVNLHPADGVGPQEDQYAQFMQDMGADPASGQTLPFDAASKPYMDTLFKDVLKPLKKDGVDFWWLDWQQYPDTRSIPSLTNLFWLNTLLYENTSEDGLRGLSFSRWAGWGDQRHPIHFSGDASTSFRMLAFEVPFTSTAGNVGCFFWSHDIGGHNRGRNEESYARWVQFGATSAALRSHSTRDITMDRRPWLYSKWATDSMRISFHLRDQLFPYIYSSARETVENMTPLNRPLYIDHPDEESAYHQAQEYMYGDGLLVSPVVSAGVGPGKVSHQSVWFPNGDWYSLFTGEHYAGGTNALVSATIDEFPIYARGGIPIPMQLYTPRMATAPLNTLIVRTYPGKAGDFDLYEDDGETTSYQSGAFAVTHLRYRASDDKVEVTVGATKGSYTGQTLVRDVVVELPMVSRPTAVDVNGSPATFDYDESTQKTTVTIRAASIRSTTLVTLHASPVVDDKVRTRALADRLTGITGRSFAAQTRDAMLAQALDQTSDAATRDEILAAAGIGYIEHNQAPYLYRGEVKDQFFADPRFFKGGAILADGRSIAVSGKAPIDVTREIHRHRNQSFVVSKDLAFTIAGHDVRIASNQSKIGELMSDENVAGTAKVTVSGVEGGYSSEGAVDGVVGGYAAGSSDNEWSSGATEGAWIQLDWTSPQTIDRIVLYDRPNLTDQVTSGTLTFSDGSTLKVGALPNDAKPGLELRFPRKAVTWVRFTVDSVKPGTQNSGLSEFAVFRAKP